MRTKLVSFDLAAMVMLIILAFTHDEASAQRYVDPRTSWSGYESWCSSMGGTVYNDRRGVGCTGAWPGGGSSPESGYAGGSPMTPLMGNLAYEFGRMIGEVIVSILDPGTNRNDAAIAARRQQELIRQQQQWEEWRREEERRRREFEEAKERMLGQMRGVDTGSLRLRDQVGSTELKPRMLERETVAALHPRDLGSVRTMTSFQRAHCVAYLLSIANEAASKNKFNEAAHLSNQAGELMGGGQVGVMCPPASSAPGSVASAPTKESAAAARQLEQEARLYSGLYSRANQQVADFTVANEAVRKTEAKLEESKEQEREAQRKVDELKAKRAQEPEQVPESVLDEALKALQDSERLRADAENDLQAKKESLAEIESQIRHTKDLFIQAQKNPDQIGKILEKEFSRGEAGANP